MDAQPLAGLLGCIGIAALLSIGLYGAANGYLTGSTDLLAPSIGTAIVALVVVGTLVGLGTRASRRLETPYW
ncbi:hypothetical protein [Halopiger aswanensis]|uniref:Uncharacterized protein n=1 Tax=Halopiger aswanensis TaxID=148449 RepID=A0A3R7GXE4_9EURY|nr:hypothetical protein [Halopiger aswanensis]RKD97250.1 hypothetical protein ATJ93_0234 [Halopiger aswanensis]